MDPLNASVTSLDGVLLNQAQTALLVRPSVKSGTVVIPEGATTIGISAFADCKRVAGVVEPQSFSEDPVGLARIYFEGNPPAAGPQALVSQPFEHGPTVDYRAGTTGWQEEFAGRPTVLWDPRVASDASFGVTEGQLGFLLTGAPGLSVVVEATPDLERPVWTVVGTLTLTSGGRAVFRAPSSAEVPTRFYRFRSP